MTSKKQQRLLMISIGVLCLGAAASIILTIFSDNIVFFYSPTDVQNKHIEQGRFIRVGGLVKEGSLKENVDVGMAQQNKVNLDYEFIITDMQNDMLIKYSGILPNLFRDGQGIVAEGKLENGVFKADKLLAKHDEKYMPPEVADALKKSGYWKGDNSQ